MNIGRLDKRVTIQSRTTVKDVYGQPLDTWSDIATVWASIEYIGGREKPRSGVVDASLDVTVAVRYYEQLTPPKDSDGWRIVYVAREGTRYLSILGSRDLQEERRFIVFDCKDGSEVQS